MSMLMFWKSVFWIGSGKESLQPWGFFHHEWEYDKSPQQSIAKFESIIFFVIVSTCIDILLIIFGTTDKFVILGRTEEIEDMEVIAIVSFTMESD